MMTTPTSTPPAEPETPTRSLSTVLMRGAFCLIVAGMLGFSLVRAVGATIQVEWPPEWDILRDFGTAQSFLEGRYPEDPILAGKTLWYNPLTGAMLALFHLVSGISVPRLGILLGPYLNLLTPLGFVVLLACLFGRSAALAGLCVVLYAKTPASPFWVQLSYSPWLMAPLYAPGLMFLALAAFFFAVRRRSAAGHVLAGGLLGITFMAHTAPAVTAGGTMLLLCIFEAVRLWRNSPAGKEDGGSGGPGNAGEAVVVVRQFALLLLTAFIVSLPYTWSILWNYGFRVRNPYPSLFAVDYVLLERLPARLLEGMNWRNGFALLGFLVLLRRRDLPSLVVLLWTVTVALFMAQHYAVQSLVEWNNTLLPGFAPGHHWAIQWSAARAALFAVGITAAGSGAASLLCRLWNRSFKTVPERSFRAARGVGAFVAACLAGGLLYFAHPLTTRMDFQQPDLAGYRQFHGRHIPMYEWILKNTPPDAVFLCREDSVAMTVVMPAARKLMFPMLIYSNPFVDTGPLGHDNAKVYDALQRADRDAFCGEASRYAALYLLLKEEEAPVSAEDSLPFFTEVHRAGGLVALKAEACD